MMQNYKSSQEVKHSLANRWMVMGILIGASVGLIHAQDETERKIQAGLGFTAGLNFNQPTTKKMEVDRVGSIVGVGLDVNYRLTNTIGFSSGLSIDFERNYITPSASTSPTFYQFNDTKILRKKEATPDDPFFQYTHRTQKPIYLTIPIQMLFRTKYFGYFRYYGKFGLRTSILVDNKIDDEGFLIVNNEKVEAENNTMEISRDMNPLRGSAGFHLGSEWNFSGSTSVFAEFGYYFGFIPIYNQAKEDNQTQFYLEGNPASREYYSNSMSQNQMFIKIGILF